MSIYNCGGIWIYDTMNQHGFFFFRCVCTISMQKSCPPLFLSTSCKIVWMFLIESQWSFQIAVTTLPGELCLRQDPSMALAVLVFGPLCQAGPHPHIKCKICITPNGRLQNLCPVSSLVAVTSVTIHLSESYGITKSGCNSNALVYHRLSWPIIERFPFFGSGDCLQTVSCRTRAWKGWRTLVEGSEPPSQGYAGRRYIVGKDQGKPPKHAN